jgi:tRNA uridine 5-carboxymethylaminomethyl modification enzyme
MIDDLITHGTTEPYRMFTSRSEYRLSLRADNADSRLTALGIRIGAVQSERKRMFEEKQITIRNAESLLHSLSLTPNEAVPLGLVISKDGIRRDALELLSFPHVTWSSLEVIWPELTSLSPEVRFYWETEAQYAAYVQRQQKEIEHFQKEESLLLPESLDYASIPSLSNEIREKLARHRPQSLGAANRIPGITPAALAILAAYVRKSHKKSSARAA